nr:MAG TPA: protein of unknown function (DUF3377) [Caudoviricetes sp.]
MTAAAIHIPFPFMCLLLSRCILLTITTSFLLLPHYTPGKALCRGEENT